MRENITLVEKKYSKRYSYPTIILLNIPDPDIKLLESWIICYKQAK